MTNTVEFRVTGEQKIHCEGCEQRIDRALRRLSGVKEVRASAGDQRVEVTLDPERVERKQVRECLQMLGYEGNGGGTA
jgi:copper chaperone